MTVNAAPGRSTEPRSADVVIIGDGVIGLSTALELARCGATCTLVGHARPGAASHAAAGLLAPSVGQLADNVRPFFLDSLNRFPAFIASLAHFDSDLTVLTGLIDVSESARTGAQARVGKPLTPRDVAVLEPALFSPRGARVYERDGAVDNVRLVGALRQALMQDDAVHIELSDPVAGIELSRAGATVRLGSGARISTAAIVVAAGAWAPQLSGLPRPLPVAPLKGQMLALAFDRLRHPITADEVYVVPRRGEVAIGATAERVGFDISTHPDAIEGMRRSACAIIPALANAPLLRVWAGLRPVTADLLPIIGPDPDDPRLIYACGHSKNGILLAPATAAAVAALAMNQPPAADLTPFAIARFSE